MGHGHPGACLRGRRLAGVPASPRGRRARDPQAAQPRRHSCAGPTSSAPATTTSIPIPRWRRSSRCSRRTGGSSSPRATRAASSSRSPTTVTRRSATLRRDRCGGRPDGRRGHVPRRRSWPRPCTATSAGASVACSTSASRPRPARWWWRRPASLGVPDRAAVLVRMVRERVRRFVEPSLADHVGSYRDGTP